MLIDTNIISELSRIEPNKGVLRWVSDYHTLHISVITLDELMFGLSAKPNPRISKLIDGFVNQYCIILPVDENIARHAGQLRGSFKSQGIIRHQADMLIASTASIHDLTLVTRNTKDFQDCGIRLLNPFE